MLQMWYVDVFHAVVNKILKRNVSMVIERTVALRLEGAAVNHNIKNVRMVSLGNQYASCVVGNTCALLKDATFKHRRPIPSAKHAAHRQNLRHHAKSFNWQAASPNGPPMESCLCLRRGGDKTQRHIHHSVVPTDQISSGSSKTSSAW